MTCFHHKQKNDTLLILCKCTRRFLLVIFKAHSTYRLSVVNFTFQILLQKTKTVCSVCKPCFSVRPQNEYIFIPYTCIYPLWDIASWDRVSSLSNPSTSKHLSSSGMNNYRLSWYNLYTYINVVIQRHLQSCEEIHISEPWSCKFTPAHEASQRLIQHTMLPQEMQDGINETVMEWCHSSTIACAASRHLGKPSIHGTFVSAQCMAAFRMYSTTTGGFH